MLKKKSENLTLFEGIALAIGSIMGSGILFLPSLTVAKSGTDAILGWILITLFCIPGLFFLQEMSKSVSSAQGIAGFIHLGLGEKISRTIPYLILGTVVIGMPSAALIASKHVGYKTIAYLIIALAIAANMFHLKTSALTAKIIASLLIFIGIYLVFFSIQKMIPKENFYFSYNPKNILNSCVLAFWAYAGFENLTFLAPKFRKNSNDLILSALIAMIICGAIYIGLTFAMTHLLLGSIDSHLGLMQLAQFVPPTKYSGQLIAFFAFLAVLINFVSWIGGIKELLSETIKPRFPLLLLGILFTGSLTIGIVFPSFFDSMLAVVSSNFLILYLLCLISYFNFTKHSGKKIIVLFFIIAILIALLSYKWLLLYPLFIMLLTSKKKYVN